jgi:hypothetical protein
MGNRKFRADALAASGHLDAASSVFFARELEQIDGRMYDVKYAALEAFELVPTNTSLDPGTESYTYRQFDARGIAEITSNYASGSPRADVDGQEFTSTFRSVRNSYGYNVQEIRAASKAGRPLEPMRAVAARRGMNERINRTALLGDAPNGLLGLFNQPNAQVFVVPNGNGGTPDWPNKTADEILDDLFGIVDQIPTVTAEVERPTRLLVPYTRLRLIERLRIGPDSTVSVLKYFKEQRPSIEVRGALFLDTAGLGGTMRMVAYDPKPENLELMLPVAFESFPPEQRGLEFVVENHARIGGVVARYPLTMAYGDGI